MQDQQIRMFEDKSVRSSAPGLFSDELFLPWIQKLMLAYRDQENDLFIPMSTKYSKAYYTKKVN